MRANSRDAASTQRRRWGAAALIGGLAGFCTPAVTLATASAPVDQRGLTAPDTSAPAIVMTEPERGVPVGDPAVPIRVEIEDPLAGWQWPSGLDRSSVSFSINGADRSADVSITRGGWSRLFWLLPPRELKVIYLPPADRPLPEGEVTVGLSVADRAGNVGTFAGSFIVDTQPPTVNALSPAANTTIADVQLPLTYQVADAGAGVDADSVTASIGGEPVPAERLQLADRQLTIQAPDTGWAEGALSVDVSLADTLGHGASTSFTYDVSPQVPLAAYPRAVPAEGSAPLRVSFTPNATAATAIERYEWDFNGDGVYDLSETVGRNQSYVYNTPGSYTVSLRVTDTRGERATGTVEINVGNAAPVVSAEASPSNGAPPLAVTFTATARDSDGISLYEWDFEGNGTYDLSGSSNTASHTYARAGTFRPRVRVVDTLGAATVLAVPTIEVRVAEGAPTVSAQATPGEGQAPLNVQLSATASHPDGVGITTWEWDFDGDGAYDYSGSTPDVTHQYTRPGTYYARVRATAEDGSASVDSVKITVALTLDLRVLDGTIDPAAGGAAGIETELGGDTEVSLVIEDRGGHPVRTLVPWWLRAAGTYQDTWNGLDGSGGIVPEGDYRAVLLYRLDGETRRYDLGVSTGGVQSNPPRTRIPRTFAPFAGDPLEITYTLSRASEVTAFMGRYNVNTRLVTFSQREPQGAGSHTIVWNGENAEGQLMHPPAGDSFLFGIFAYTLPDNAIFVRSGVHASAIAAAPPVFDPTGLADDGTPAVATMSFQLSRVGQVELTVHDADSGELLRRQRYGGFEAGSQTLTWDGRTDDGTLVAPGRYRLGITGIDDNGQKTTTIYALQRVFY